MRERQQLYGERNPALSVDEEKELFHDYAQTHDETLCGKILDFYAPLAYRIAHAMKRKLPKNVGVEGLVCASIEGLWSAIKDFELRRGIYFKTYAELRIRNYICDWLREEDDIPRQMRPLIRDIEKRKERLTQEEQRPVMYEEVVAQLPLQDQSSPYPKFQRERPQEIRKRYLDRVIMDSLLDQHSFLSDINLRELEDIVLHKLTRQETYVFAYHYYDGLSFEAIGKRMGLSHTRIFTIHQRAIERLQKNNKLMQTVSDIEEELSAA